MTNDKTLQHIYKIISKKLEDLNNKSTSSRATSTVSKKSSSSTRSRSPKLSQPKPEPKIYHIQKDKVQSSCCSFFKHQQQVEPKKIYTARSVQTDFEKFDPEKNVKETDKIRKWDIQNAPVLDIPPTLKLQKLNSVNISPSCSKTFEPQNSATYNFKYNCPDPVKDSNKSEIIITQKDQVPERDTNVIENRVTEKPPKVPNKSPKLLNYQKNNIKIQRAKKKLNFNDSSSRSLSLENIQLSAVDKILQRNSERLDTVSRKTLKICKALHRHVLSNNFKNYDQTSSTDHVASSVSLDLVSSNFGTPSESNHQKEKGQKTKMSDNQEEFSIDSSDFELLKNLSSDQDSRDEGIFQREEKEDLSVEKNDKTQNVSKLVHVESMEINNSGTGSAKESDSDEICKADQVKIDDFKQHVGQVKSSDKNRELGSEDEPKKLEEEIQSTEDDLKDKRLLVTESEDGNNCEKDVTEDDDDKVREKFSQTETEGKMLDGGLVECRKNLSDELNNEQRYRKYVRKCVDMNKSLAEQISFRINEEMQMIIEKTQRELSFLKSSSAESDENRFDNLKHCFICLTKIRTTIKLNFYTSFRSIEKEPKMDKKVSKT